MNADEERLQRVYTSAERFLKPPPTQQCTLTTQQRRFQQHAYSHLTKLHAIFQQIIEQQRQLDELRVQGRHVDGQVRRLEGELEAGQKRIRCLTDDLEEARAPFVADQGGC